MVAINDYEDQYQPDFKKLNLEWLAHDDGKIIATAALMNEGNGTFELAKMELHL